MTRRRNLTAFLVGFTTMLLLGGSLVGIILGVVWVANNYSPLASLLWAVLAVAVVCGFANIGAEARKLRELEAHAESLQP